MINVTTLILKLSVFSILDGDVPRSTSYRVNNAHLILFARASSPVSDFNTRNKLLTQIGPQCLIAVFSDHTHLLFYYIKGKK